MPLYPTTVLTAEQAAAPAIAVVNGGLVVVPVQILPGSAVEIVVVQTSEAQDHSLRCFVSNRAGGDALAFRAAIPPYWHANRDASERVVLAAMDRAEGDDAAGWTVIPVTPGDYALNVLNLVNTANGFALMLTEL